MREYLFSVIIPVYNTEPYLREAFDSIVNQTVGFEDNIQLIIINDGSPDNSEEICLEYKEKYPENIIYIKQENQGVSAARNVGIDTATGKYINFLDSDDLWELDAFEKAGEMLDANDDIDVVGVKVINFENREGDHILNYKFKKDKVVDIHKDFNYIQTQAAPSFIRREALSNIRFNTKLKFLEDAFFMCEVILQKEKYGVLGSSAYMYRRRNSEDSATQTRTTDIKATYIDSLETFHEGLIKLSREKDGKVIPYVQFYIAYDYQWRIKENLEQLDEVTKTQYLEKSRELLEFVDIETILALKKVSKDYKIALINFKLGKDIREEFEYDGEFFYYDGIKLFDIFSQKMVVVEDITVDAGRTVIEGWFRTFLREEDYELTVLRNGKKIDVSLTDIEGSERAVFGKKYNANKKFVIELPEGGDVLLRFDIKYKTEYTETIPIVFGESIDLNAKANSHYIKKDKIIGYADKALGIFDNNTKNRMRNKLGRLF